METTSAADDNSFEESLKRLENSPEFYSVNAKLGDLNFFELLRVAEREVCHSEILAWLLSPDQSHGLGNTFLMGWLKEVFNDFDSGDHVNFDEYSLAPVQVLREWKQIDLVVKMGGTKGLVIAIENKIWSNQHSDQLPRYYEQITKASPDAKRLFILLSVNGEIPAHESFRIATYQQVLKTLEECLRESQNGIKDEPRMLIEHYIRIIRNRFMPNPEIEELVKKLESKYAAVLDVIWKYRSSNVLRAAVVKQIQTNTSLLILNPEKTGSIDLLPANWKIDENLKGDVIYFQLELEGKLRLTGWIGNVEQTWKMETFELLRRPNWSRKLTKQRPTIQWLKFYMSEGQLDGIDTEATEVMDWLKEQVDAPEFDEMVQTVARQLENYKPA
jgi:hypothetical protein